MKGCQRRFAVTLPNSPLDWHANLTRVRVAQGFASGVDLVNIVVADLLERIKVIHNPLPVSVKTPNSGRSAFSNLMAPGCVGSIRPSDQSY
jgi:hypothetical protein